MNRGWAAASALIVVMAACGGPTVPPTPSLATPTTGPPDSSAPRTSPSIPNPATAVSAVCRMSDPVDVTLPASLAKQSGIVAGLSDTGEMLVSQMRGAAGADQLSLLDPATGAIEPIVSRTPAKSPETAASQIAGGTANPDWIVWSEVGFTLEEGDWTVWAKDRHSGDIRAIQSSDPGRNGRAVPGWTSTISLLGNLAVWSAPIEVPGNKTEPRVYVANLATGVVKRLDVQASWPSLVAADRVEAAVATGIDSGSGKVLSAPGLISLPNGEAGVEDWTHPARTVAFAASASGSIAAQLLTAATSDASATVAVTTRDADGIVRVFDLQLDWGPVGAGVGFLVWQDQAHLWIMPTGTSTPIELESVPDDTWGIAFLTSGSHVYWWTDNVDKPGIKRLAEVICE